MENANGKLGHRRRERRNQLRIEKKRNALQKEIDKGERDLLKQQKNKRQKKLNLKLQKQKQNKLELKKNKIEKQ